MPPIEDMTPEEIAEAIETLRQELIRRQNIVAIEREVNDLLTQARENGVTQTPEPGSPWVQPVGAHDAYLSGDTVTHKEKSWSSLVTANVWEPGVSGWRETVEDGEVAEWVQPTGAHDAYKKGDSVTFEGAVYVSLIDGNTWSPGGYPAGWRKED